MRLMADLIRGERVNKALNILKYEPKVGSPKLGEAVCYQLFLAGKQRHQDVKLEEADLYVKEMFVDGGRILEEIKTCSSGTST